MCVVSSCRRIRRDTREREREKRCAHVHISVGLSYPSPRGGVRTDRSERGSPPSLERSDVSHDHRTMDILQSMALHTCMHRIGFPRPGAAPADSRDTYKKNAAAAVTPTYPYTVSATLHRGPPVSVIHVPARGWGSRAPQPLTYVGVRVAQQDYNTHWSLESGTILRAAFWHLFGELLNFWSWCQNNALASGKHAHLAPLLGQQACLQQQKPLVVLQPRWRRTGERVRNSLFQERPRRRIHGPRTSRGQKHLTPRHPRQAHGPLQIKSRSPVDNRKCAKRT